MRAVVSYVSRLLAVPAIVSCVMAAAMAENMNVFPNGDMTRGDGVPEGWSIPWLASGKLELRRDTETFKGSPASLALRSVGGPAVGGAAHALTADREPFTISGFVKSSGQAQEAAVAIQVWDASGKQIQWVHLATAQQAGDWQQFSKKVELLPQTVRCQLVLTFRGEGEVWLDEVTTTGGAQNSPATSGSPRPSAHPAGTPVTAVAEPLPVEIPATDPAIRYIGRFDMRDKAGPRCAWSASNIAIKIQGTSANVKIEDAGQNRWQIAVDGAPTTTLQMRVGEHLYSLAEGLPPGEHTIQLMKATEASVGVSQILGFQLGEGDRLLQITAPTRRLEVIGDSISCGYGNEAVSKEQHFSPKTENAWHTYGAIAARKVGADYLCVAWSGKKMWPDNTIPELYDRTLPLDATSQWDFGSWSPDAVVINLATNDFAKTNPDEAGWTAAYKAFIARLRQHHPNAQIYCAIGPMMGDWGPNKALTTVRRYIASIVADVKAGGDPRIGVIDFGIQDFKNGIGADWHPSMKTHEIMGAKLAETLQRDLNW